MLDTINNWWLEVVAAAAAIGLEWHDLLVSLAIIAGAVLFAVLFSRILFRLLLKVASVFPGELDDHLVSNAKGPITAYIILLGVYLAVKIPLELPQTIDTVADRVFSVAAIAVGAYMISAIGSTALRWFQEYLQQADAASAGSWALPLARRGMVVVVFVMAGMVSLDILGINISPLIAGLGIGGLAVALALQPTLSNFFAGTYVITEGVISAGDYIELENGIAGYVVDVNWRSTRLRTWTNNLVVIPNSRFAETIITNYDKPDVHVNVYLVCGVALDSDLQRAEIISREVMTEVLENHPGAVREYGSYFAFDNFGESNINFWLFIQAEDRLASFWVRSELIKRLQTRLSAAGIVISYPVRTLRFPPGWGPDGQHNLGSDSPPAGSVVAFGPMAADVPGAPDAWPDAGGGDGGGR